MHLELAALDDGADGVQDSVAGPRLGGDWVIAGGRSMPVIKKVVGGVNFKDIITFVIHRDFLSPRGLEILHQVDYRVSM